MNGGIERQPVLPTNTLDKYLSCMEEIKKRIEVVHGFLQRKAHALYLHTTVESICLQVRKVLELIALASLVANESAYAKHRKNFQRDWHAKRILATLEKANPHFYPQPTKQRFDPETGKVTETLPVTSGYLTRKELEDLYDQCSALLHASNPFSRKQQNVQSFLDHAPEWIAKIQALLNHHQIQLIDEKVQLWVLMHAKEDGKVHVYEFHRVDQPTED